MPNGIVCPIDGTQLVLVNNINLAGDSVYRWECPVDDWAGPWYSKLLSGETEPIPETLRDVVFIGNQPITTIISNNPLTVDWRDDYNSVESFYQQIEAGFDTTFTFTQSVRLIRISNWNTDTRVLVKDGPIDSNSDMTAARVGRATLFNKPGQMWFPLVTTSIHLRARLAGDVTVEGYFGDV